MITVYISFLFRTIQQIKLKMLQIEQEEQTKNKFKTEVLQKCHTICCLHATATGGVYVYVYGLCNRWGNRVVTTYINS